MRYSIVIDGYNFLHAQVRGRLRRRPDALRQAREHLLRWLQQRVPNPGEVLVVFDSNPREFLAANPFDPENLSLAGSQIGIAAAFATQFATADEYILDYCQGRPPGSVTVVSNDRVIQREVRRLRMRWTSCEEFAECLAPVAKPPSRRSIDQRPEKPLGTSSAEIDAWLREFGLPPEVRTDAQTGSPCQSPEPSIDPSCSNSRAYSPIPQPPSVSQRSQPRGDPSSPTDRRSKRQDTKRPPLIDWDDFFEEMRRADLIE